MKNRRNLVLLLVGLAMIASVLTEVISFLK